MGIFSSLTDSPPIFIGVAGDSNLPPIWYAVSQGKRKTEGLDILNQAPIRGLPSFRQVFGGMAHFSTYLPLPTLVINVSLMNPSISPYYNGGVHAVADQAENGRGVHPWGF